MLALIDADSLLYKVGFALEEKNFWNEFDIEGGSDESPEITYSIEHEQAQKTFNTLVENIMFATDCDEVLLVFSGGHNFRLNFPIEYKLNRTGSRKPTGYSELLMYVKEHWPTYTTDGIEADDYVVWYYKNHDDCVLCAIDKDIIYQSVGTHYNYGKDEEVTVDEWEATKYAYFQTLTGDQSDGYKGCRGIGAKRAEALLEDCSDESCLWTKVLEAYEAKGHTYEEALWTMRLANMHQYNGKEIVLWEPPF